MKFAWIVSARLLAKSFDGGLVLLLLLLLSESVWICCSAFTMFEEDARCVNGFTRIRIDGRDSVADWLLLVTRTNCLRDLFAVGGTTAGVSLEREMDEKVHIFYEFFEKFMKKWGKLSSSTGSSNEKNMYGESKIGTFSKQTQIFRANILNQLNENGENLNANWFLFE